MKCSTCNEDVLESEIYTDYYYCIHCSCTKKIKSPKRSKGENSCKHEWHEEEMRGLNTSRFFCVKCGKVPINCKNGTGPLEQFQCRKVINNIRCQNQIYRKGLGDAFDYPHCDFCEAREDVSCTEKSYN